MTISFICPHHKDWLYFHSEEGIGFIEDAHRKGQYLLDQAKFKKAIPFLGAAFEATEIMLELYGNNKNWLLAELSLVATQLMECLTKAGANEHVNIIAERALVWLNSAAKEQANNANAMGFLQNCILEIKSVPQQSPKISKSHVSMIRQIMMKTDSSLQMKNLAH